MPAPSNKPLIDAKRQYEKLTVAAIDSLKSQGYSQSDIARMFGVTRQAVSWHKQHYGGRLTPRELALEHFPWVLPVDVGQCSAVRRLRDHGEYVATGGIGMSEAKLSKVRHLYDWLRDRVIEYDPAIPPEPGVSLAGGIAFRKRLPSDEDLLIRVNEYTHLSDQGRMIWRFPPVEP